MILLLIAVQFRLRTHILRLRIVASLLWVVHFLLLGAPTGAMMNVIGAGRTYVFNRWGAAANRSMLIFWSMFMLTIVAGAIAWHVWWSIFPIIGMSFATVATWQRNEQKIRFILLLACPFWFIYNVLAGSYAGMLTEVLTVVSLCVSLWRYRKAGGEIERFTTPA